MTELTEVERQRLLEVMPFIELEYPPDALRFGQWCEVIASIAEARVAELEAELRAIRMNGYETAYADAARRTMTAESRVAHLEAGIKVLVDGAVTADFGQYIGDELNEDLALGVRESDLSALLNGTDKDTE